jgi:hypothetical protein
MTEPSRSARRGLRVRWALAGCAMLVTLCVIDIGPPASATTSGMLLWARRYDGPVNGDDTAYSIATSPGGKRVFVTGSSAGDGADYGTVAYATSTGQRLWTARYDGPVGGTDMAVDIAVSSDGSAVFVTGVSDARGGVGWATVAYDAASGSTIWSRRHRGGAQAVAASLDGSMVFVTGSAHGDFATLAYDATTGATRWASRYDGPANLDDGAASIFVTADRVFVTGTSYGSAATLGDYATVALDAARGHRIWVRRYNGPGDGYDFAASVVGGADGSRIFVTGDSAAADGTTDDFATVAYDSTGQQLWVRRFGSRYTSYALAAAAAEDGSSVVVTGYVLRAASGGDFATIAYDGTTGAKRWLAPFTSHAVNHDTPLSIAMSPDSDAVYVTGQSYRGADTGEDVTTLAYGVDTGALLWSRFYTGAGHETDLGWSIGVSPDASEVLVTGKVGQTPPRPDYVTLAYEA